MMDHSTFVPTPGPHDFKALLELMRFLRSPAGCPWDRKQTLSGLQKYLLEESYEAVSAFQAGDMAALREELGDVLLQVVFQSQVSSESGGFSIHDVIDTLVNKLLSRHSHLFGDDTAHSPEDVKKLWDINKAKEKSENKAKSGLLAEVKQDQSPLHVAWALQAEAAKHGFDWPDHQGPAEKVLEELAELREAGTPTESLPQESPALRMAVFEEAGDLLFAVVNLLRKMDIEPETALAFANVKFSGRFMAMESLAEERGLDFRELKLAQQDQLWDEVKKQGL